MVRSFAIGIGTVFMAVSWSSVSFAQKEISDRDPRFELVADPAWVRNQTLDQAIDQVVQIKALLREQKLPQAEERWAAFAEEVSVRDRKFRSKAASELRGLIQANIKDLMEPESSLKDLGFSVEPCEHKKRKFVSCPSLVVSGEVTFVLGRIEEKTDKSGQADGGQTFELARLEMDYKEFEAIVIAARVLIEFRSLLQGGSR
jgi:hypothetical protein